MYEHKTIIDSTGLVIERCVLFKDGIPIDFELKKNQKAIDRYTGDCMKPQLINGEWIETATQEELNTAYPVIVVEPTTEETLSKELAAMKIDNMKKDIMMTNALKTIADLKVEVMNLKGGK
ncbi:hypothetical protein [Veillonella sp.]|uniref:hypothetical protein n=1 Tax=Veillonella sp. TaxID=1926307 RepID=UPI00290845C7|nr:hypothetical protein [Veillonella sp.]MDU5942489.1 hypothetical protein [Veillonella sp.]MDU6017377.1 hypothetical protein [Clostridium perfringens]